MDEQDGQEKAKTRNSDKAGNHKGCPYEHSLRSRRGEVSRREKVEIACLKGILLVPKASRRDRSARASSPVYPLPSHRLLATSSPTTPIAVPPPGSPGRRAYLPATGRSARRPMQRPLDPRRYIYPPASLAPNLPEPASPDLSRRPAPGS